MSFANAFYRMQMLKENAQRRKDEEEGMKATLGLLSEMYGNNRRAAVEPYAQKATLAQIMQDVDADVAANRNKNSSREYFESLGMTPDEVDAALSQTSAQPVESVRNADGSLSPVTPEMQQQWAGQRANNLTAANAAFDTVNNLFGSNPYEAAQGMNSRQLKYVLPYMMQQDKLIQAKMGEFNTNSQIDSIMAGQKLTPQQRMALELIKAKAPGEYAKILAPAAKTPLHVNPGDYVQNDDGSWTQIGTPKAEKPVIGTQVKLANGSIGVLGPGGSIQDTGQKFYVAPKENGNNKALDQALKLARAEDAAFKTWQNDPLNRIKLETDYPRHSQRTSAWASVDAIQNGGTGAPGGGQQPAAQPQSNGMSPVMQDFAQSLTGHIQKNGPEATRQWINANREALQAKGIDPDAALTWIPQ